MADNRSRYAFGSSANIQSALASGAIDAYDVLLLDGNTDNPKVGWIDKDGNPVIVKSKEQVIRVSDLPQTDGDPDVVYIWNNDAYVWDGTKCVPLCEPTDLTELQEELANKVDAEEVDAKINAALDMIDEIEYEISHKPDGTLVDYRDKEIRIMCPTNTELKIQQSGENADKDKYYIGFKAYAPSNDVVSFKEDLGEIITDNNMYYFENNDFAGVDENGRKYSIVWLPVALYNEANDTWKYYGENSSVNKYIGWYYSVEWYNSNGIVVSSDCIRINLANEECYSSVESFYVNEAKNEAVVNANKYTDEQIAAFEKMFTIIEF